MTYQPTTKAGETIGDLGETEEKGVGLKIGREWSSSKVLESLRNIFLRAVGLRRKIQSKEVGMLRRQAWKRRRATTKSLLS